MLVMNEYEVTGTDLSSVTGYTSEVVFHSITTLFVCFLAHQFT